MFPNLSIAKINDNKIYMTIKLQTLEVKLVDMIYQELLDLWGVVVLKFFSSLLEHLLAFENQRILFGKNL